MNYPSTLKALTIWEPWASLIAIGAKRFETRGWKTDYRGPLAIHSAARPVSLEDLRLPNMEQAIRRWGLVPPETPLERFPEYFPTGEVVAVANLINCLETTFLTFPGELQLTEEYYIGDFSPGRFGWELAILESFPKGAYPAKGAQGLWTFTFPDSLTNKEPAMATKKKEATEKKKPKAGDMVVTSETPGPERTESFMGEDQAKDEKNSVDKAFSKGAGIERAGVASDPGFDKPEASASAPDAPPPVMPDIPVYAEPIRADEYLPAFQKIVFVKFSREDLAIRAEKMAACDEETKKMQADLADYVKERKQEIAAVEAQRAAYSSQVTAKGEEREVECRKRINEATQEAVIFNAVTMEIVETKKLTAKEMQVEMQMADTHRAAAATAASKPPKGSKVVQGNFPKDKVIGAGEPENPAMDQKNETALQALAGKE